MQVNLIKRNDNKCYLSITFSDEIEEHVFLQNTVDCLKRILPVNCILTDLDTSYSIYEKYFDRENYYVFDRLTTASIFAFDLNSTEIQEVISNWGYFTIDAIFALGAVDDEVKNQKRDSINIFKSMPVVITQVLDNSIDIVMDQHYLETISKFLNYPV